MQSEENRPPRQTPKVSASRKNSKKQRQTKYRTLVYWQRSQAELRAGSFGSTWFGFSKVDELVEALEIVCHAEQIPLQGDFLQAPQRERSKTQNSFNDAENRFDTGLAAQVALASFCSGELLFHRHQHGRSIVARVFPTLLFIPQIISTR